MNQNLKFCLETMGSVSCGIKRRGTVQKRRAHSSKACITDGIVLHECRWRGRLERHCRCKVYRGFRSKYTPIQTTSLSGKALHIYNAKQHTTSITTVCLRSRRGQVLNWCSPVLSQTENIWRIIK